MTYLDISCDHLKINCKTQIHVTTMTKLNIPEKINKNKNK